MPISRRTLISATLASAGLSSASYSQAQTPEVKLALVAPLSGAWARTGQIMKTGAELAVADINAQGGIKSMGGAKIRLISADAGDSVEKAKNAAQRLLSQEPDLVGGIGAWLSSFTLAVTEVTERAQLPWVTLSYANQITERGFKYVVQDGPDSVRMADESLPAVLEVAQRAIGRKPQTVAIISDSTVVSQMLAKRMRDEGIKKYGIKIVVDETYGSPLSDATSMVQAVRQSRPDFLLFFSTNVPDAKLVLDKMTELGLGRGRVPIIGQGTHLGSPEMLQVVGAQTLEGLMFVCGNWPSAKQAAIIGNLVTRSKEPWWTQDTLSAYGEIWLLKDAIERAGSRDRVKVMQALSATSRSDGPAQFFPGKSLKFEPSGRRVDAPVVLVQWQGGKPLTVSPAEEAIAKPIWVKR